MKLTTLIKKAESGDTNAQTALGAEYFWGKRRFDTNKEEGFRWLMLAAKKGNPYAQYNIGSLYLSGEKVSLKITKKHSSGIGKLPNRDWRSRNMSLG